MHLPHDRRRTHSVANRCYSLYTSPGLKGQNNSAQGIPKLRDGRNEPKRRRSAELTSKPGKGMQGEKPSALPAAGGGNSMNKANNSLRAELQNLIFGEYETIIFVRNMNFTF